MTSLLKFTQGATVGSDGQALKATVVGGAVQARNSDNTGVASWEIKILEVPYGSAVPTGVLAQANGSTPLGSWSPDVSGGCYRIQLTTWPQINRQGTADLDIRNVGVDATGGLCAPPAMVWPLPLPDPRSGLPNAKPNEMNFAGQDDGWAGSGNDGLARHLWRLVTAGVGSGFLKLDGTAAMAATLDMGTHAISNVADPTSAQQAATRRYVDRTTVTESTTARSTSLADCSNYIRTTNAAATTITVIKQATVATVEACIMGIQAGAGQITFAPDTGVTINTPETLKTRKQYSSWSLRQVGSTNVWDLAGDLELA